MKKMLLVLIISCFFFGSHSLNSSSLVPSSHFKSPSCPSHQKDTLLLFKNEFQIHQIDFCIPQTEAWNEHNDCCSWEGVTCDPKSGLVIELDLSNSCLLGRLSSNSSLFRLHHLQWLYLSNNNFSLSSIPSEFSRLTKLTYLVLRGCGFSGSIPVSFRKLSKLTFLDLSSNKLKGFFPSALLNLTELVLLHLSFNELKGKLPSNMSRLSKLYSFDASSNGLTGTLPPSLFMIPSLYMVYLHDNQLVGPLNFENASSFQLTHLDLSRNNFSGSVPRSITKFVNLGLLDLSFQGADFQTDLSLFTNMKNLYDLSLAGNTLWIENLPSSFNLPKLESLNLSSCNIGVFPNFLKNSPDLLWIDLFNNSIKGQVPRWLWQFPKLDYLDISFNSFDSFEAPYRFQTSLQILRASNNNITGKLSKSICNLSGLKIIDLSNNHFSGSIPRCLVNLTSLFILSLQKNNLSGPLPRLCNNDSWLKTIDVGHNRLEGELPRSLMKCGELEYLNVGGNQINDTFPFWMTSLTNLQVLVLSSNLFHGPIWLSGISFGFSKLRIIDVSYNAFTGDLPSTYFSNWTAISSIVVQNDSRLEYMEPRFYNMSGFYGKRTYTSDIFANTYALSSYQDSINLMYKGNERELEKIPTILTAIDYSNNRIKGPIPDSIGELKALNLINLSGNAFTGQIPRSLINLTNLEALDFSQNRLSGEIPQDLGKLTSLAVINLSYNEFTGGIPQKPQFQTQSPWSYVGNPGLCGAPLPECYTPHHTVEAVDHSKEEEEEEVISWIAAAIAFVPAFVVAATITHTGAYKKLRWVRTNSEGNRRTITR